MQIIIDWIKYHAYLIDGNLSCAVICFFLIPVRNTCYFVCDSLIFR